MNAELGLDDVPLPAYVVRGGAFLRVNHAFANLLELTPEALVGEPMARFLPEVERPEIAARLRARPAGEPQLEVHETSFLTAGGRAVRVEVRSVLRGDEVLGIVLDVSGRASRAERLEALARLGARVQHERTGEAVLAAVYRGLVELGLVCARLRQDGDRLLVEGSDAPADIVPFLARYHLSGEAVRGMVWSPPADLGWRDGVFYLAELQTVLARVFGEERGRLAHGLLRGMGLDHAVGLRVEDPQGATTVFVASGRWVEPADVPIFQLFRTQVEAALAAARALADVSARSLELDARNRVVEVAEEAPDLPEFFARAAAIVQEVVGCQGFALWLHDAERDELVLAHVLGAPTGLEDTYGRRPVERLVHVSAVLRTGQSKVQTIEEIAEPARALFASTPYRTFASVALRVRSRVVGVMSAAYHGRLRKEEVRLPLLEALAGHFASAVEAQQLLDEARGRVSMLELLNDTALASAAMDPRVLLEGALPRVFATARADVGAAYLLDGDELVEQASIGMSAETVRSLRQRLPLTVGPVEEAIRTQAPVLVPDMSARSWRARLLFEREGVMSAVVVPLTVKGQALGILTAGRRRAEPFLAGELGLLSAVAAQLGVAVENARLLAQARRQVANLEAVNAVALEVFGGDPGDSHSLLAAASETVGRALGATSVEVLLLGDPGRGLRRAASWGRPVPAADAIAAVAGEGASLSSEVLRTQRPARCEDTRADPRTAGPGAALSVLVVPMSSRAAHRGVLAVVGERGRRFSESEVALAFAVASTMAIGLENALLHVETRQRAEELAMLDEVGRSVSASLDLREVLRQGAESTRRLLGASDCLVTLLDRQRQELWVGAHSGEISAGLRAIRQPVDGSGIASTALRERRPVRWSADEFPSDPHGREVRQLGVKAAMAAPLLRRGEAVGALVVIEARRSRAFTAAEEARVVAVASPLAVAVENAQLFDDLRRSYADLARAQKRLVHRERLAALGELSAVVAHEVRNPLAVIFNSLGSLQRMLRPQGDAKLLLDVIQEEADRLNRTVGDLLDFARPVEPSLRPEALDKVVEEAVAVALARRPEGILVVRDYDSSLPPVPVDTRQVRQAVLNLVVNAVQAMPRGGTLTVRTRVDGPFARLEIADSGPGVAAELRQKVFEPFFTTKPTGTGLGLAVVRRIADGHGGTVEALEEEGGGAAFVLRFPLAPASDVESEGPFR